MKLRTSLGVVIGAFAIGCSVQGEAPSQTIEISTSQGLTARFEPSDPTVGFARTFTVRFRNESSQAHNLVFVGDLEGATRTIVEPGDSDEVEIVIHSPGTYPFVCTIHESMQGSLTIGVSAASR